MKYSKIMLLIFIFLCLYPGKIYPCTMIMAGNDTLVLAGNNEDHDDPLTYVWFFNKSADRKYGVVYFGYSNLRPQGGMNEAGLCFDAMATVLNPVVESIGLPLINLMQDHPMDLAMKNSATVDEAIDYLQQYDLSFMGKFQIMFVDKYGNSAILEGDNVVYREAYYQVCTNFYQSNPSLGGFPCWRYDTAVQMFEDNPGKVSVPFFREVLDAVHQEGQYATLYSNIYDLKKGLVYLYLNHSYDEVLKINLADALHLGNAQYEIAPLYSGLCLLSPCNAAQIDTNIITFCWKGAGKNYQLIYSNKPDLSDASVLDINVSGHPRKAILPFWLILFLPLLFKRWRLKTNSAIFILLFVLFASSNSCSDSVSSNAQSNIVIDGNEVRVAVEFAVADTAVYWQVKALNEGPFRSESDILSFTIN